MLIEVLTPATSSFSSIRSVTNVVWLHESSKAFGFTYFWELQCLNLTGTTHMLLTSPTTVAAFLIPAQLLFMASVCSTVLSVLFLMFSFSSFYNLVVLMGVCLDIPNRISYYCMFLLFELTLSLYRLSQASLFLSPFTKHFFICFSLLWFCFSGPFVYSWRASLENNRSFTRVISSSTNCIKCRVE